MRFRSILHHEAYLKFGVDLGSTGRGWWHFLLGPPRSTIDLGDGLMAGSVDGQEAAEALDVALGQRRSLAGGVVGVAAAGGGVCRVMVTQCSIPLLNIE